MSQLSTQEAAAVFGALDPNFKPDVRGRYRGPATYRGGDNRTALSIDTSAGGRFYDHVAGTGGDTIDYVRVHLGTDFKGACRAIAAITGRDPTDKTRKRKRFSPATLVKAERFKTGLLWRIDRYLDALKAELWRQLDAA